MDRNRRLPARLPARLPKHPAARLLLPALAAAWVLALGGASPALANDAAFYGEGATVFAIKEERIVMERESITIRFDADTRDIRRRWVAECEFVFRNRSKQAVEVQMGFPDWHAHGEAPSLDAGGKPGADAWAIRDFAVQVAGTPLPVAHKAVDNRGGRDARPALPRRVKLDYDAAYTWTLRFEPGETIVVKNSYRFGGFSSNGPFDGCVWGKRPALLRSVWWRNAPVQKGGWDFENCVCQSVTYIVSTGRTWGGPIGQADIAIQIPPGMWPHLTVPLPAAASVSDGWVRWRFRRWTPRDELGVVFVRPIFPEDDDAPARWLPLFDTPAQAGAWVRFARQNGFAGELAGLLRKAYELRHGLAPHPEVQALVGQDAWGPRPANMPAALSAAEKRIVGILSRFEKQAARKRRTSR